MPVLKYFKKALFKIAESYLDFKSRRIVVKIADTAEEREEIYKLNYDTFTTELGQYQPNPDERLVDKFDDKNVYIIAKDKDRLIGMISIAEPTDAPFSIESRLDDPSIMKEIKSRSLEVRLFAISKEYRGVGITWKIGIKLAEYLLSTDYEYALISGITTKEKLYRKVGFVPLGPAVPYGEVSFIPMYITRKEFYPFARSRKEFRHFVEEVSDASN